jgi:hypothetical protein
MRASNSETASIHLIAGRRGSFVCGLAEHAAEFEGYSLETRMEAGRLT